jgi:succinate dehydrogenase/fumarate reductase flavoprotein subunit
MNTRDDLFLESDLVIVGSEGAGSTAALEASRRGLSVIMLTKGNGLGRGGATIAGEAGLAVDSGSLAALGLPGSVPEDRPERFFEDIVCGGKFLNRQDLVEVHVQAAPDRFRDLLDWGLTPRMVLKAPGHRFPRSVMISTPQLVQIFRKKVKGSGVRVHSNIMVQELLTRNGRCLGVVGLDLKTGRFLVVKSRATLLATGGGMRIYPVTTAPEQLTGDGLAMALRAGVELADMEFPMFLPGCFPWPPALRGVHIPFKLSSSGHIHGHLLNRHGERFMAKWDPVRMERSTRDILAAAMGTEIEEGRGGPHGGVYVSLKHLPDNLIEDLSRWLPPKYLETYGGLNMGRVLPDLTRHAVESVPGTHFFNGGIRIDSECRTNLPGLYAAGEVTAGIHGGNRISDNAFTEMIVWGHRGAVSAFEDLRKGCGDGEIDPDQLEWYKSEMLSCFKRKQGENVEVLRDRLMKAAAKGVGPVRNEESLRQARVEAEELRKGVDQVSLSDRERIYNRSWLRTLELKNMIENLSCIVEASLRREESRGAHYRKDFPRTDNEQWLFNQILSREAGEMVIRKERPVITSLEPPSGVIPYGA